MAGEIYQKRLALLSYEQHGLVRRSRVPSLESFLSPPVITSGYSSSSSSKFWLLLHLWPPLLWCYQHFHSTSYCSSHQPHPHDNADYLLALLAQSSICVFLIIKCEALQEYWPILVLSYESIPFMFIQFSPERLVKEKTRISDLVNVCTSVVLLCKNIIREDVSSMMVLSNGVNNPCSGVSRVNAHLTLET